VIVLGASVLANVLADDAGAAPSPSSTDRPLGIADYARGV
jgi:hypothetical protein